MLTFLERYNAVEHIEVWKDLVTLGPSVRQPRYLADASSVAAATMRRAARNLDLIIRRLHEMGYRFLTMEQNELHHGDGLQRYHPIRNQVEASLGGPRQVGIMAVIRSPEFRAAIASQADRAHEATMQYLDRTVGPKGHPWQNPEVLSAPTLQTLKDLDRLEELAGGPVPLSLRAWYEQVGSVSLLGWHSELSPNADEPNGSVAPDPFMLDPLSKVIQSYGVWRDWLDLAPDPVFKHGEGGCGPLGMRVPNPSADGMFTDVGAGEGPTFVAYLRNAFKWGGFPGWERRPERPQAIIDTLTDGLLPF